MRPTRSRGCRKPSEQDVEHVSHLVLMVLLPALADGDLEQFGRALTEMQEVTGRWFASAQGGTFAAGPSRALVRQLAEWGADGRRPELVGSTVYGIVDGAEAAARLVDRVRGALGSGGRCSRDRFAPTALGCGGRSGSIDSGRSSDHATIRAPGGHMIKVSVMYPNTSGAQFDMAYYLDRHMPMVQNLMGGVLKGMNVEQGLAGGQPGVPATYAVLCHLLFESVDAFQAAFAQHSAAILADIPNYTNTQPTVQISQVKL